MDHSFSRVVEYNGRSYRVVRLARRRDPSADRVVRNSNGQRVSYEYVLPGPKRARVAASAETIRRLLREVRAGDASRTECAVCLQDYAAEETVSAMPACNHAFHHHCISEWLARNAVCPICRRELSVPTQQQQQHEDEDEVDEHGVRRSWNWRRVPAAPRPGRYYF